MQFTMTAYQAIYTPVKKFQGKKNVGHAREDTISSRQMLQKVYGSFKLAALYNDEQICSKIYYTETYHFVHCVSLLRAYVGEVSAQSSPTSPKTEFQPSRGFICVVSNPRCNFLALKNLHTIKTHLLIIGRLDNKWTISSI